MARTVLCGTQSNPWKSAACAFLVILIVVVINLPQDSRLVHSLDDFIEAATTTSLKDLNTNANNNTMNESLNHSIPVESMTLSEDPTNIDSNKQIISKSANMLQVSANTSNASVALNDNDSSRNKTMTSDTIFPPYNNETIVVVLFQGGGRLGNHLWQYASVLGIYQRAAASQQSIHICYYNNDTFADIRSQWALAFPPSCPEHLVVEGNIKYRREGSFARFQNFRMRCRKELCVWSFSSYLQSYKYFAGVESTIQKSLRPNPIMQGTIDLIWNALPAVIAADNTPIVPIGIHVRRGDVVKEAASVHMNIAPLDYYSQAMAFFREKYPTAHFFLASDDKDWCRNQAIFGNSSTMTILPAIKTPIIELALVSNKCQHFIMGVGSYGWWAAFLTGGDVVYYQNPYKMEHKKVKGHFVMEDMYPPNWIPMIGSEVHDTSVAAADDNNLFPEYNGEKLVVVLRKHKGRLGNQLWQYASVLGIYQRAALVSNDNATRAVHICYRNGFGDFRAQWASVFPPRCSREVVANGIQKQEELSFARFQEFEMDCPNDVCVWSFHEYLQSYKYFIGAESLIRTALTPSVSLQESIDQIWNELPVIANDAAERVAIGIHVRRGDIVWKAKESSMPIVPLDYYSRAMDFFLERYPTAHFFLISDDKDWCRRQSIFANSSMVTVLPSSLVDPIVELALISDKCQHFIMGVGSYGWWAGFLAGGDVVYYQNPSKLTRKAIMHFAMEDMYPPEWIPMLESANATVKQYNISLQTMADNYSTKTFGGELELTTSENYQSKSPAAINSNGNSPPSIAETTWVQNVTAVQDATAVDAVVNDTTKMGGPPPMYIAVGNATDLFPPYNGEKIVVMLKRGNGRLGNQIWRYASILGVYQRAAALAKGNSSENVTRRVHVCYNRVDAFQDIREQWASEFPPICSKELTTGRMISQEEDSFARFQEFEMDCPEQQCVLSFNGYLQSYKYFVGVESLIRTSLQPKQAMQESIDQIWSTFSVSTDGDSPIIPIGMHVRRGDVVKKAGGVYMNIAPLGYYSRAMAFFLNKYPSAHFYLASDDKEWCRNQTIFGNSSTVTVLPEIETPIMELALVSNKCQHFIMGVGSYGWWAAFLAGGDVVYYQNPFKTTNSRFVAITKHLSMEDMYPPEWIPMLGSVDDANNK